MPFGSDNDAKDRIRQSVDIVELVGGYLELRRQGRLFMALCPWHEDSRPSLQVNPDRQTWRCWVCNDGGDIFSFVQKREGVGFREALEMLAERAGVELDTRRPAAKPGSPEDKKTLYEAASWAAEQFHQFLLTDDGAASARAYAERRGITAESIRHFRIGFSANDWQWLLHRAQGTPFTAPILEAIGLAAQSERRSNYYDRFRGRLMFPIHDLQSRTIAFGGRILPELAEENAAKYINSPETRLFSKSEQLYALDRARDTVAKSRAITIVEGYTDVIMAHQHGLIDVAAVLGTALGPQHIRILKRYADTVFLVLDGDDAGRRRANQILEQFVAADLELRIITLPDNLDPCDYVAQQGAAAFRELRDASVDALEHKIRSELAGVDPTSDTHRANRALENILSTMSQVPGSDSKRMLREQQILSRLAREFFVPESDLRSRIKQLRQSRRQPLHSAEPTGGETRSLQYSDMSPHEIELLEIVMLAPSLFHKTLEQASEAIISEPAKRVIQMMRQLHAGGMRPDFETVLTAVDDSDLKNILVQLDDEAEKKVIHSQVDPQARLTELVERLQRQKTTQRQSELQRSLSGPHCKDEDEELDLLKQIYDLEREQQGVPKPTDG